MASFRVTYSGDAIREIRSIRRYIVGKLHNPSAASRQTDRIMSAAESLAVFPKMHRVRFQDSEGRYIRVFPVDKYLMLYSVDEDKRLVSILHVVHGKRDIDALI